MDRGRIARPGGLLEVAHRDSGDPAFRKQPAGGAFGVAPGGVAAGLGGATIMAHASASAAATASAVTSASYLAVMTIG